MFGIGMPELILILAVALIVIGPKKLPDLAKSLGRAMNEFRKATREIKDSLDVNDDLSEVRKSFDELKSDMRETLDVNPLKSGSTPKTESETPPKGTPSSVDSPPDAESPGDAPDERG